MRALRAAGAKREDIPEYKIRVQAEAYACFIFSLLNDRRLADYQARLNRMLAADGFAIVVLGDFGGGTGDGAHPSRCTVGLYWLTLLAQGSEHTLACECAAPPPTCNSSVLSIVAL